MRVKVIVSKEDGEVLEMFTVEPHKQKPHDELALARMVMDSVSDYFEVEEDSK